MTLNVHPQWIAKMYPSKKGRDHLGLGSVSSDKILPVLSPGINVLTIHPRYYSFYVFLLDEFWQRDDRPRSRKAWVSFYRPREFIFSIGANLCDRPEHKSIGNIVGSQKTAPLAHQQRSTYDTAVANDPDNPYIESELGGYGLYYRSVIMELGLVYPGGPGLPYRVDLPTERGKEIAAAFRKAVKDTAYYRRYFDKDATKVPIEVIREYIRKTCLCQLKLPDAPDQFDLLDVFLHEGHQSEARRATFRLLLDIASQTKGNALDEHAFRQLIYFGSADNGAAYRPQPAVINTYRQWRLYQTREYYAFALNALWAYLCDWGLEQHGDVRPVPLAQFWGHLDQVLDFNHLAARLKVAKPNLKAESGFQSLLDWIQRTVGANSDKFDFACKLTSALHEDRFYELAMDKPAEPFAMVTGMIVLLAIIYLRFGRPPLWLESEWYISQMGADGRLSLDGFVKQVRAKLQSGSVTVGEIVRWLYRDYIILQHQLVATSKLPENTFRFQREGDRLRFYNLENPLGFMDSRFVALSTAVHELGLCGDLWKEKHPLTRDGQRLLAEGDL